MKQWLLTVLVAVTLLSGCTIEPDSNEVQQTFYVFGTAVTIQIYGADQADSEKAIQAIEADFHQFNREWHAWEKGGLVSKINQAIAEQRPIDIPAPVKQFIVKTQQLSKQSDYLFDPAIGKLVALWGFHSEDWKGPPPPPKIVQEWLNSRPSIADIHFNGNQLISKNPKVQLDFGGNAKGLALDRAMQTLKQASIDNAIVNIGGDMRMIGQKHQQPWRIGIQNPFAPEQPIGYVELKGDISIVTSGAYQRFFEWQGQRYSHVLNPNTGYPAQNFVSVTVIHSDATTADTAATALMVAGPQAWEKIAAQMGIEQAFMVDQKGQFYQTPAMEKALILTN